MTMLLNKISKLKILGLIPGDTFLHIVIGFILMIICLKFLSKIHSFTILVLVSCVKELIDSTTLNSGMREHIIDIGASLVGPILILIYIKYCNKKEST
jgi:hypothetical protein